MPSRLCEVRDCINDTDNYDGSFFIFPQDPRRLAKWKENLGPLKYRRKKLYVCSQHFGAEAFSDTFRRRLHSCAVPDKRATDVDEFKNSNGVCMNNTQTIIKVEVDVDDREDKYIVQNMEFFVENEAANTGAESRQDQNLLNMPSVFPKNIKAEPEEQLKSAEQTIQQKVTNICDNFDETDRFFISISNVVKMLSQDQQAQLKMQISTLVGNAESQHI